MCLGNKSHAPWPTTRYLGASQAQPYANSVGYQIEIYAYPNRQCHEAFSYKTYDAANEVARKVI